MVKRFLSLCALSVCVWAGAVHSSEVSEVIDAHILPSFARLAEATEALNDTARSHCTATDPALRDAYATAFDAWVLASHLRFGPTEIDDRAFALAFWPDSRGKTQKALSALIRAQDPVVNDPEAFRTVSIAARGFYALEYLLFDPAFNAPEDGAYHCALVQAISTDIAANSAAILADWQSGYADLMKAAGENDTYQSDQEAAQELFKAMVTGLQFTSDTRLGRSMGTFERPRPNRAEARRSGRSLRHVVLSLQGTQALAMQLSGDDPALEEAYARAFDIAARLDDPIFAAVAEPQGRLRLEVLKQAIDEIRRIAAEELGPRLGVAAGFNSLDGD